MVRRLRAELIGHSDQQQRWRRSLPFAGVVSTPVVDAATAIPDTSPTLYGVVFLTSLCRYTTTDTSRWYLHELDLTNNLQEVAGSNSPVQTTGYATNNSSLQFAPGSVLQRSALLEVKKAATPRPRTPYTSRSAQR